MPANDGGLEVPYSSTPTLCGVESNRPRFCPRNLGQLWGRTELAMQLCHLTDQGIGRCHPTTVGYYAEDKVALYSRDDPSVRIILLITAGGFIFN